MALSSLIKYIAFKFCPQLGVGVLQNSLMVINARFKATKLI